MAIKTIGADQIETRAVGVPGPVALDFYQATCPPCRTLEPRLECVAAQYAGRLPVYRVEIDHDMPVAQRFGVMSIPTVLILCDGREAQRLDGLITERDLTAAFDAAVGQARCA